MCKVLGLKTRYADAETERVLQGRAQKSLRVLIPDTNVADCGFHDVTLLDMAEAIGPAVHVRDLTILRWKWSLSVLRHASKQRFCRARTGC